MVFLYINTMNNELINVYRKFPRLYKVIALLNEFNLGRINTYHNNLHSFEVFEQCVDIVDNLDNLDMEIKEEELYVSALFHDYNHIGKMGSNYSDSLNIERALCDFEILTKNIYDEEFIELVNNIIKSTQYPSIMNHEDKTIEMLIIGDADMTAQLRNNCLITIYGGMKREMNVSDSEFFINQKKFIENLNFNTQYCKDLWEYFKPIRLEELENLASCYQVSI